MKNGTVSVYLLDKEGEILSSWENLDAKTGEVTENVKMSIMKKAKYLMIAGKQKGMTGNCNVICYGKPTLKTKCKRLCNEYFGTNSEQ